MDNDGDYDDEIMIMMMVITKMMMVMTTTMMMMMMMMTMMSMQWLDLGDLLFTAGLRRGMFPPVNFAADNDDDDDDVDYEDDDKDDDDDNGDDNDHGNDDDDSDDELVLIIERVKCPFGLSGIPSPQKFPPHFFQILQIIAEYDIINSKLMENCGIYI